MPRKWYPCASVGCGGTTQHELELKNSEFCTLCRAKLRHSVPVERREQEPGDVLELRRSLDTALRDLARSKTRTTELVLALQDAATAAIGAMQIPPVPQPAADTRTKQGEVAIAVLADWQLAKVTPSYSTEICEQRVEQYAEKVIALTNIQRADHPVRELRVYLLGDLIEGELIFPGQAHLIDASLYSQVLTSGPRILGNFLRRMAATYESVRVVGVIGNHGSLGGRARRDYHPETNADAMMYEVTRQVVASEPRITWQPNSTPGERKWYAVDYVGKSGFMLFHGDQVKSTFGYPWYGLGKKILGWANSGIPEPFHYALSGHFHTPVRTLHGRIRHWGSGSTESDNTYAAEYFASCGTPSQWLLFCHPDRGVTAEYEVHLS